MTDTTLTTLGGARELKGLQASPTSNARYCRRFCRRVCRRICRRTCRIY